MRPDRSSLGIALAASALAASAALAADAGFELRPGAVVDASRTTLYTMEPRGGIAAIEIASGRVLWTREGADRPLYADDEVLVAQAAVPGGQGMLHLVVLDPRDPSASPATASVEMPAGTRASLGDDPNSAFDVRAFRSGDAVLVGWTFTRREKRVAEPAEGAGLPERRFSGAVRVPLGRGPAREIDPAELPDPQRAALPSGVGKSVAANAVGGGARRVGDLLVLAELPSRDPRQTVRLHRWRADGGEALEVLEAFGDGYLVKHFSADGRYLMASREAPAALPGSAWDWATFDVTGGRRGPSLRVEVAAAPFFVADGRVVTALPPGGRSTADGWQEPGPRLVAIEAASGRVLWSREVGDPTYTGPLPPAR